MQENELHTVNYPTLIYLHFILEMFHISFFSLVRINLQLFTLKGIHKNPLQQLASQFNLVSVQVAE